MNSVDRDGELNGYDLDWVSQVRDAITIPLTVLGGAGTHANCEILIRRLGVIGAAAASLFVLKGEYRAVLINYPSQNEKDAIIADALSGTII